MAAAPVLAASILAGDSDMSFLALLFGFTLSECWRAPAAILIRDVSPPGLGSAGAALHLCVRNLIGGMGPLGNPLILTLLAVCSDCEFRNITNLADLCPFLFHPCPFSPPPILTSIRFVPRKSHF